MVKIYFKEININTFKSKIICKDLEVINHPVNTGYTKKGKIFSNSVREENQRLYYTENKPVLKISQPKNIIYTDCAYQEVYTENIQEFKNIYLIKSNSIIDFRNYLKDLNKEKIIQENEKNKLYKNFEKKYTLKRSDYNNKSDFLIIEKDNKLIYSFIRDKETNDIFQKGEKPIEYKNYEHFNVDFNVKKNLLKINKNYIDFIDYFIYFNPEFKKIKKEPIN